MNVNFSEIYSLRMKTFKHRKMWARLFMIAPSTTFDTKLESKKKKYN